MSTIDDTEQGSPDVGEIELNLAGTTRLRQLRTQGPQQRGFPTTAVAQHHQMCRIGEIDGCRTEFGFTDTDDDMCPRAHRPG